MIKIEREYVSHSGTKYVRILDAKSDSGSIGVDEKIRWKSENRRIRRGRYLSMEQWNHIEEQVEEAYAMEYDVDFSSIFDIYPRDYRGNDGVIFYETYYKGDEQFGHSSNIIHIGAVGSYVPQARTSKAKDTTYNSTKTTSFKFYADKAAAAKADAAAEAAKEQPQAQDEAPELSEAAIAQAKAEAAMKARIEAETKAKQEAKAARAANIGKAKKAKPLADEKLKKNKKESSSEKPDLEFSAPAAHHELNITIQ